MSNTTPHLQHIEELIWHPDHVHNAIDSILQLGYGAEERYARFMLTEKVDGAPAFVFGRDTNGFFVSTKLDKLRHYSISSVHEAQYSEVHERVLSGAFSLNSWHMLNLGGVYRADCIRFDDNDVGPSARTNIIRYHNEQFTGRHFVACVHTPLYGTASLTRFGESLGSGGYLFSNVLTAPRLIGHNKLPVSHLNRLEALKTRLNAHSDTVPVECVYFLLRIGNRIIKDGSSLEVATYNDMLPLAEVMWRDTATDKNKAGRFLRWLKEHADLTSLLLDIAREVINIKKELLAIMHRAADQTFTSYYLDTDEKLSEGMVVVDKQLSLNYKLVDREKFSILNFRHHGDVI